MGAQYTSWSATALHAVMSTIGQDMGVDGTAPSSGYCTVGAGSEVIWICVAPGTSRIQQIFSGIACSAPTKARSASSKIKSERPKTFKTQGKEAEPQKAEAKHANTRALRAK